MAIKSYSVSNSNNYLLNVDNFTYASKIFCKDTISVNCIEVEKEFITSLKDSYDEEIRNVYIPNGTPEEFKEKHDEIRNKYLDKVKSAGYDFVYVEPNIN